MKEPASKEARARLARILALALPILFLAHPAGATKRRQKVEAIGFVVISKPSPNLEATRASVKKLAEYVQRQKKLDTVFLPEDEGLVPGATIAKSEDFAKQVQRIIAVGGDGTVLHAASQITQPDEEAGDNRVALLGLNAGTLGFYSAYVLKHGKRGINAMLNNKLGYYDRTRVRVVLRRDNGVTVESCALNDCVIHRGGSSKLIKVNVTVNDQAMNDYRGDGVMFLPPSGTTAYNLAVKGPILTPDVAGLTITPIASDRPMDFPMVIPDSAILDVRPESEATLHVDGRSLGPVGKGDTIHIQKANSSIRLYNPPGLNFFEHIRDMGKWGSHLSPKHHPEHPQ